MVSFPGISNKTEDIISWLDDVTWGSHSVVAEKSAYSRKETNMKKPKRAGLRGHLIWEEVMS